MKSVILLTLLAIVAMVTCAANPYSSAVNGATTLGFGAGTLSQANSLQLSDTYNWAFAVTQQVKLQIKALQDAIDALKNAVDSATVSRDASEQQWKSAQQRQAVAQSKRDEAKNVRDNAQSNFDRAYSALTEANGALDNAVTSLQQLQADFEKKSGAYKAASNIRDVEEAFKLSEIAEFCKIVSLIGAQHGQSKYCGPNGPITTETPVPETIAPRPTTGERRLQFQSVNYPEHRFGVRQDSLGYIIPENELTALALGFRVVPALSGTPDAYSFASLSEPTLYLRHQNYRLKFHPNDGSDLFLNDASFKFAQGLAGKGVSFESVNYPNHFIRHRNYELWLDPANTNDELYRNDASFIPIAL
jgi:hypothetical protein